jgi:hypothetical protein
VTVRARAVGLGALALAATAGVSAALAAGDGPIEGPATASQRAERALGGTVGDCAVFPPDNPWNQPVTDLPLRGGSAGTIAAINASGGTHLHPDFGENPDYGIPYVVVPADQPLVPITYDGAGDESDLGPVPIPLDAPVEAGSDRHVLVVRDGTCDLYELFAATRSGAGWRAYSGAHFDLSSNALRPLGWTSADAAGLPILPGLVRYEEVASGRIRHAIRMTFARTQRGYILPATHFASSRTDPALPPMGLRLRLRADYDVSGLSGQARVIAVAMQEYGVIVADNGSNWFFQGAPSPGWDDDELNQLKSVPGSAFEVVDTGPVLH